MTSVCLCNVRKFGGKKAPTSEPKQNDNDDDDEKTKSLCYNCNSFPFKFSRVEVCVCALDAFLYSLCLCFVHFILLYGSIIRLFFSSSSSCIIMKIPSGICRFWHLFNLFVCLFVFIFIYFREWVSVFVCVLLFLNDRPAISATTLFSKLKKRREERVGHNSNKQSLSTLTTKSMKKHKECLWIIRLIIEK